MKRIAYFYFLFCCTLVTYSQTELAGYKGIYFCANEHFQLLNNSVRSIIKADKEPGESFSLRLVPAEIKSNIVFISLTTDKTTNLSICQWNKGVLEKESPIESENFNRKNYLLSIDLTKLEYASDDELFVIFYIDNASQWSGNAELYAYGPEGLNSKNLDIYVYPNTASEYLNVTCPFTKGNYLIIDSKGIVRIESRLNYINKIFTVNLSSMKSGSYLLVFVDKDNNVYRKNFVVSKR